MSLSREVIDLTKDSIIDLTASTSDSSAQGDELALSNLAKEIVSQPTPSTSTATPTTKTAGRDRDKRSSGNGHSGLSARFQTPPTHPHPSRHNESKSPTLNRNSNASGSRFSKRTPTTTTGASAPAGASASSIQNMAKQNHTPRGRLDDWSSMRMVDGLKKMARALDSQHRIMNYMIIRDNRKLAKQVTPLESTEDLFAGMKLEPVPEEKGVTVKAKFKQHSTTNRKAGSNAGKKHMFFNVTALSTRAEAVPPYRFHHIEIAKSILTPQTCLKYAPHVRDLDESEEVLYSKWLQELNAMEEKSGFKAEPRDRRAAATRKGEQTARLAAILPSWLVKMEIPGVAKPTLIRYMATQEQDDTITPQQKSSIVDSQGEQAGSPEAVRGAKMFTEAFDSVFNRAYFKDRAVSLRDVLFRDEAVDTIIDSKRLTNAKEGQPTSQNQDGDEFITAYLETHSILACLICFSNSCEHGEFDAKNDKQAFSQELWGGIVGSLDRRDLRPTRHKATADQRLSYVSCGEQCFRRLGEDAARLVAKEWDDREVRILKALVITARVGEDFRPPECNAAAALQRPCWDVRRKVRELGIRPHSKVSAPPIQAPVKNLSWYDRHKKALLNDWQDHHAVYEHQRRELIEPCNHEGPCTAANDCLCYVHDVLCDRFCRCTAETCARKFTGCACHSLGKNCYAKQKERPCICVQLNRECDPGLCGGCGAYERANPDNRDDDELHQTGCQNCVLQRAKGKAVVLGNSQLEGCGYGLWAAEDIAQDEFVIEYVGEVITHDEGVRREARRGDAFNQEANPSYIFTLLDNEGIWVDAAVYGNLSRYINHAIESDKKGCNMVPKILYVNGEYRIRFSAMRDIKCGEELFFNYGENFPNLTKKLLEDKDNSNKKADQDDDDDDIDEEGAGEGTAAAERPGRRMPARRSRMLGQRKDGARRRKRGNGRLSRGTREEERAAAPAGTGSESLTIRSRKRKRAHQDEGDEEEEGEEEKDYYRLDEIPDSQEMSDSTATAPPLVAAQLQEQVEQEQEQEQERRRLSGRRTKRTRRFSPDWDAEVGPVEVDSVNVSIETPTRAPATRRFTTTITGPQTRGSGGSVGRTRASARTQRSESSEIPVRGSGRRGPRLPAIDTEEEAEEEEDDDDEEQDQDEEDGKEEEEEESSMLRTRRGTRRSAATALVKKDSPFSSSRRPGRPAKRRSVSEDQEGVGQEEEDSSSSDGGSSDEKSSSTDSGGSGSGSVCLAKRRAERRAARPARYRDQSA